MAKISLGDLQKAADEKYGPFVIEDVPGGDVVLLNSLRLPKEKKVELERLQTGAVELARRLAAGELSDDELKEATVNPGSVAFCGSRARTTRRRTGCSM
jgi:hypothetical protein